MGNPIFLIFRLFPTSRLSDSTALTWTDVAWYPHYIFNHCMAPDEETGRIYVLGGQRRNGPYNEDWGELRYYEESSNSWHGTWNMIWHRRHRVRDCQDGGRR